MIKLQQGTPAVDTFYSRGGLVAAGFTDQEIRQARTRGALVRLDRGIYAADGAIPGSRSAHQLLRILGVAARSPALIVSHTSAAVLHNIPLWGIDPAPVHLTRDARGGSARTVGRVVHSARVAADEVDTAAGVPVTSVARTLVDLARTNGFESAVIACDYALHKELVTPADLSAALDRAGHRPGNPAARRALAFADGRAESVGESRTRVLIHRLKLKPPELQIDVLDRFGTLLGRTDLGYEEDAALIEFDGKVKYLKPLRAGQDASEVVIAEKQREDQIRSAGVSVLRIVWSELGQPTWLGHRITETRRQGRALKTSGATSGTLRPRVAIRMTDG